MKLSSPPMGFGQSFARYVFASARASPVGVIAIFVAFVAGAAAGFSPPPQPEPTMVARARARATDNLERRQVMGRCSLRDVAELERGLRYNATSEIHA